MNVIKIFCLISITLLSSCADKDNAASNQSISMNQAKRNIADIKKEVRGGNIESYNELRIVYLDYPSESFLYWAIFMANKYDYSRAYMDVFYCLVGSYVGDMDKFYEMDKRTQELALEYLKIASRKGEKEADEILRKFKK